MKTCRQEADREVLPEEILEIDGATRLRRLRQSLLEHLLGPTGSMLLHVLILLIAWRFLSGTTPPPLFRPPPVVFIDLSPPPLDPNLPVPELEPEEWRPIDPTDVVPMPSIEPDRVAPIERVEPPQALAVIEDIPGTLLMPGLTSLRTEEGRRRAGALYAPQTHTLTDQRVLRALDWLKERQQDDGSWVGDSTASSKTAMTGLALLTFLAHGEMPGSKPYGDTVEKAIRFLVEQDLKE
ncbi:MAG: hypothetical protein U1E27_05190, partial [Kiritimatiellia bacterium]|nr:hypothetical protein [Kiritimatiellia bacterium]